MTIDSRDVHLRWMQDPKYAQAYATSKERVDLACQMAEARARSGLNQEQLAEAVGTTQTQVSRWERGKAAPTGNSLRRFAEVTHTRLLFVPEEAVEQVIRLLNKRPKRRVTTHGALKAAARETMTTRGSAQISEQKRRKPQRAAVATS